MCFLQVSLSRPRQPSLTWAGHPSSHVCAAVFFFFCWRCPGFISVSTLILQRISVMSLGWCSTAAVFRKKVKLKKNASRGTFFSVTLNRAHLCVGFFFFLSQLLRGFTMKVLYQHRRVSPDAFCVFRYACKIICAATPPGRRLWTKPFHCCFIASALAGFPSPDLCKCVTPGSKRAVRAEKKPSLCALLVNFMD